MRGKALLAMMVARYDRQLAARLLEPELREIGTHSIRAGLSDFATTNVLSALALIDPQQAVERVLALPDDPGAGTDTRTTKNQRGWWSPRSWLCMALTAGDIFMRISCTCGRPIGGVCRAPWSNRVPGFSRAWLAGAFAPSSRVVRVRIAAARIRRGCAPGSQSSEAEARALAA